MTRPAPRTALPSRPAALVPAAALAAALFAAGCADPTGTPLPRAAAAPRFEVGSPELSGGRYIVQLAEGVREVAPAALAQAGGTVVDEVPVVNGVVVEGVNDPQAFAADPNVTSVLPDIVAQMHAAPAASAFADGAGAAAAEPAAHRTAAFGATAFSAAADAEAAPFYVNGTQWDMRSMRADAAWSVTNQGLGAKVCIIDSGIDETHQEFAGKIDAGISFIPNPDGSPQASPIDSGGHGSHVAGSVTGNGVQMASVAPNARLLIAKVFNGAGGGATTSRIWNAMVWCADNGADVINMSLGFPNGIDRVANAEFIQQYQAVADSVRRRGALVVASAGNDNFALPHRTNVWLPSELNGVLSVGSVAPTTDRRAGGWPNVIGGTYDRKSFFSNYGTGVGVFAPGGRGAIPVWFLPRGQGSTYDAIVGPCASRSPAIGPTTPSINGGGTGAGTSCAGGTRYAWIQGTSMAAPHVAGLAAVLRAEIGGERTAGLPARLVECIRQSADAVGPSSTFSAGRANALSAVNRLRNGQC